MPEVWPLLPLAPLEVWPLVPEEVSPVLPVVPEVWPLLPEVPLLAPLAPEEVWPVVPVVPEDWPLLPEVPLLAPLAPEEVWPLVPLELSPVVPAVNRTVVVGSAGWYSDPALRIRPPANNAAPIVRRSVIRIRGGGVCLPVIAGPRAFACM